MVTAASARDLIQVNTGLSHAYTTLTADIITAQITDYQADCSARLRADPAAHADQFAETLRWPVRVSRLANQMANLDCLRDQMKLPNYTSMP